MIALFPLDAVIEQFVQISCPLPLLIATPVAPALIAEFKHITLPDEVELIPAPVETAAPVIVQDEVVTFPGPKLFIALHILDPAVIVQLLNVRVPVDVAEFTTGTAPPPEVPIAVIVHVLKVMFPEEVLNTFTILEPVCPVILQLFITILAEPLCRTVPVVDKPCGIDAIFMFIVPVVADTTKSCATAPKEPEIL